VRDRDIHRCLAAANWTICSTSPFSELDQYLLRSMHLRLRKLGDRHIEEICRALPRYDAVNLQLEHGTLGRNAKDICKRFGMLVAAAARLSVTFHTLFMPKPFDLPGASRALLKLQFRTVGDIWTEYRRNAVLSVGVAGHLRRAQRRKQIAAIAHNRRDAHDLRYLYDLHNVLDHPLAFLSALDVEAIRSSSARSRFPVLENLPDRAKLIGVFGFLSQYKGFGTAVRALRQLPDDYHLLIFGGTHPNEIAPDTAQSTLYVYVLCSTIAHGQPVRSTSTSPPSERPGGCTAGAVGRSQSRSSRSARIRATSRDGCISCGALPDSEFLAGMAICDAVVFPYLEVGPVGVRADFASAGAGMPGYRLTNTGVSGVRPLPSGAVRSVRYRHHVELAARILARPQFPAARAKSGLRHRDQQGGVYCAVTAALPGTSPPDPTALQCTATDRRNS
jgi:glycosyltransferase involved in cell wall biosynthesis